MRAKQFGCEIFVIGVFEPFKQCPNGFAIYKVLRVLMLAVALFAMRLPVAASRSRGVFYGISLHMHFFLPCWVHYYTLLLVTCTLNGRHSRPL